MSEFQSSINIYFDNKRHIGMDLALSFNCGFARVAIRDLSALKRGKTRSGICLNKRREEFQKVFSGIEGYVRVDDEFWEDCNKSQWNRGCNFILDCFGKKWNTQSMRSDYIKTFSVSNWKELPNLSKICIH